MKTFGNILWIICGGWLAALSWLIAGLLWCITIIGIPYGVQCFKLASLSLDPFGKKIETSGTGAGSCLLNVIWFLASGMELAVEHFMLGVLCCITIIGIPFGQQYFKLARLCIWPFGAHIVRDDGREKTNNEQVY